MPGQVPNPAWLYRLIHIDNLPTLLQRGALHAPNYTPEDGLPYRTIHNSDVQAGRREKAIPYLTDVTHGRESCLCSSATGASKLALTLGWKCEASFACQSKL